MIDYVKTIQVLLREIKSILLSEFSLWILISLLFTWPVLINLSNADSIFYSAREYNLELSFGFIVAVFPLAFYQVFGSTPFNYLKNRNFGVQNHFNISVEENSNVSINTKPTETKISAEITALNFIFGAYKESSELASKLYRRAGIYLVFGVLIAIGGLVFFSLQRFNVTESDTLTAIVIKVLPYAGILLFIEFIAFFFLRQYRQAMHEFRYFESIKRTRESQIFIYLSVSEEYKKSNPIEFIGSLNLFGGHGIVKNGDVSELLELEKLNKNDIELLSNFLNAIKK